VMARRPQFALGIFRNFKQGIQLAKHVAKPL